MEKRMYDHPVPYIRKKRYLGLFLYELRALFGRSLLVLTVEGI
jgi:hypothetical protein